MASPAFLYNPEGTNYRYPTTMQDLAEAMIAARLRRNQQRMNEMAMAAAAEDRRAAAEERRQRAENERFQNEVASVKLEREAALDTPRAQAPTVPLSTQRPTLNEETGGLSADEAAFIGGDTQVPKESTSVRMPGGRTVQIPLRYQEDNPDWTTLSPEAWNELPAFYQGIWKPGQRLKSKDVGEVGQKMLADAVAKSKKVPQYDSVLKKDVMVSQSVVDADTQNRYLPPQEGRLLTDRRIRELEAERDADRASARADRAAAAKEKKDLADEALADATDRIIQGDPVEKVNVKHRDAAARAARAKGARVYTTQAQKDRVVGLETTMKQARELADLLDDKEVAGYTGPGAGRITGIAQKIPDIPFIGPDIPEKVLNSRRLMKDLADQILRLRSGAQINPQEYKRIIAFTVDPNHRVDVNKVNLKGMIDYMDSLVQGEIGSRGAPTPAPGGGGAAPPKSAVTPAGEALLKQYGF